MKIFEQEKQEKFNFKRYLKAIDGKGQDEQRKIEMALLRPEPIPQYTGPKPRQSKFKSRTITLTFPNASDIKRLGSFVKINTYIDANTYDVGMFVEMMNLLEDDTLRWDPNKKSFYIEEKRLGKRRITRRVT